MSPPMVHLALLEPASCMLKDLDNVFNSRKATSASSIRVCIKQIPSAVTVSSIALASA